MAQTLFKLPTTVVSNPPTDVGWSDPDNLLLFDDKFATSAGPTNVVTIGGFNMNLNVGDTVTNIVLGIKGYRGSFDTTLQIYAVDTTTGIEYSYPYPGGFQGFSGTNTLYTLTPTLFATTWSVEQINNIQIKLIADGELHLDGVIMSVIYVPGTTPTPPPITTGELVCHEFVQAQPFSLAQAMTADDLFAFTTSFNYPNGNPILIEDFAGGHSEDDPNDYGAILVLDQRNSSQETVRITNIEHDYNGSGMVRLSFDSIDNRGLKFKYPYDHDINLCLPHTATAEVVISNAAAFYDRFLKKCQIGVLVSGPISVLQEDVSIVSPATKFNFHGAVTVVQDGTDPEKANIYITQGGGTTPPQVVSVSSATSGSIQVDELSYDLEISGLNRAVVIQVVTQADQSITGITVGGVSATQEEVAIDNINNIRSEIWVCLAPPLGTQTVDITLSDVAYIVSGSECLIGVDQSTPVGTTGNFASNSNSPSVSISTSYDYSLVFDCLGTALTPIVFTPGAGSIENWHHSANTDMRQGVSSVQSSGLQPDAITMSYSMTQSTDWTMCAVEIKGITTASASGQVGIQFDDETGTPLGSAGTVDEVEVTGSGVTGTRVGNKVTYTIAGGGAGITLETDGTPNGDQTLLNLVSGTNISLSDDGLGNVTIDATGGGSGNGSSIIENLTAGEDIDGVTEPKAVFLGSSDTATPGLGTTSGNPYVGHTGAYDYAPTTVSSGTSTVSAIARRATSITTPSHGITINQAAIYTMDSNNAGTVSANVEIGIYEDNAGEPGTLITNFTDTSYPTLNNNSYGYHVNFGVNIQLAASTTYWLVVEFVNGGTPLDFRTSTNTTGGLVWNGSAWVVSNGFRGLVWLNPFYGQVYRSYYSSNSDEVRDSVLGITIQNITESNPIDVIHDGIVSGYTGLTPSETQYVSTSTPGALQTSSTNTVKIGTGTKADEIVINRVATYQ